MAQKRSIALLPIALLLAAGCNSGRNSVSGTVTYEDGSPVESGIVVGRATIDGKSVSVQGTIKNGGFSWGGAREGDGAAPGHYEVVVMPPSLSEHELSQGVQPAVDSKFTKFESSGLSFDVKDGKNEFPIKVTRPKPRRRD